MEAGTCGGDALVNVEGSGFRSSRGIVVRGPGREGGEWELIGEVSISDRRQVDLSILTGASKADESGKYLQEAGCRQKVIVRSGTHRKWGTAP
jgi:hypothetical protein